MIGPKPIGEPVKFHVGTSATILNFANVTVLFEFREGTWYIRWFEGAALGHSNSKAEVTANTMRDSRGYVLELMGEHGGSPEQVWEFFRGHSGETLTVRLFKESDRR